MTKRLPNSALDDILTTQLIVAWAGEEERLGWWRTTLVDDYGGLDLFAKLLPNTALWAALQGVREAARRVDAAQRQGSHDPDSLFTLFRFGFDRDEQLDERLADLKRSGHPPNVALPGLPSLLDGWDPSILERWLDAPPPLTKAPRGRQLKDAMSNTPERDARALASAIIPLTPAYPMPHFRKR